MFRVELSRARGAARLHNRAILPRPGTGGLTLSRASGYGTPARTEALRPAPNDPILWPLIPNNHAQADSYLWRTVERPRGTDGRLEWMGGCLAGFRRTGLH